MPMIFYPLAKKVTHSKFWVASQVLSQAMMTKLIDFTRMNPLVFQGSKIDEDLKMFINDIYKIVGIMGLSIVEKA